MRIGYLIDVNKGPYDQPLPPPDDVQRTLEQMIEEGIVAERAGFHSLQVPHRHGRTECYFPGPEQLLTILARETDRVAIGTLHLRGDALPPDACGRAVRHHRQPLQGTALHDDVARVSRRVLGPVRDPAGEAARPLPRGREDLAGGVQGRALRLRREALAGRAGAAHARALSGGRLADLGRRQREPRVDPPLGRVRAGDDGRPVAASEGGLGRARRRLPPPCRGAREEAVHRA